MLGNENLTRNGLSITNRPGGSRIISGPRNYPVDTAARGRPAPSVLLERAQPGGQAGFIARSRILVQNALFGGLVEGRYGLAVDVAGGGFVSLGEALAHGAESGAQLRSIGPVAGGSLFSLAGAFERRKMIGHGTRLPLFVLDCARRIFRWEPKLRLYGSKSNRVNGFCCREGKCSTRRGGLCGLRRGPRCCRFQW